MRVTLKDIAVRVGVDPSAVSLALSDRTAGKLSAARVKQIREVALEIGYRPNLSASHLRRGRTQCIGVMLGYLDQYPDNHYFNLISQACVQAGYHAVPLAIGRRSPFDGDQAASLNSVHVDGMIAIDYTADADDEGDLQDKFPGHPLVCRTSDPTLPRPGCPVVAVDCYAGVRDLLRHVVSRGWRELQFVIESDPTRPHVRNGGRLMSAPEERAIGDASAELGVPMAFERDAILTPERGAKARYEAMIDHLVRRPLRPGTCLVQDGADGISGTYAALTKMGYAVGRDVAVAALKAIPAWEHVEPVVTVLYERFEEISRLLVELAVDRIEGRNKFARDARFEYQANVFEYGAVPDRTGRS